MIEGMLTQVAGVGLVGVLLVLALFALHRKDNELSALRDAHAKQLSEDAKVFAKQLSDDAKAFARELAAEKQSRIDDAKAFNNLTMAIQKEVITAVSRLGEIVEAWEERAEADRRAMPGARR